MSEIGTVATPPDVVSPPNASRSRHTIRVAVLFSVLGRTRAMVALTAVATLSLAFVPPVHDERTTIAGPDISPPSVEATRLPAWTDVHAVLPSAKKVYREMRLTTPDILRPSTIAVHEAQE